MGNGISYAQAFYKILIRPKETMQALVDQDPGYGKWILIPVYTFLAGFNPDLYLVLLKYLPPLGTLITEVILLMAVGLFFFWFTAVCAFLIGKWLGGTGVLKDVATAYAWAYVPCFAALVLLRASEIPKWSLIFGGETDLQTVLAAGGFMPLIVWLPNFALYAWSLVLAAFGISAAHRISVGKGFGVMGIYIGFIFLVSVILGVVLVFVILRSTHY
ncbi:MAG TPA: YIP1 family protein [bacterium]|nr:YIP1 family protein [bacterium]